MLLFAFGGVGGLINASFSLNLVVHNTAWMPGHFHLTVGTAVALTFMGITYWLVPVLSGRPLWSRRLALVQVWLWFGGMVIFSYALHSLGFMGAPRRTPLGIVAYAQPEWRTMLSLVGVGGSLLFVSGLLYFMNLVVTAWWSRGPAPAFPGFAEALSGAEHAPAMLDHWRPWVVIAVVLILIAYGPTVAQLVLATPFDAPGLRVW